MPQDIRIWEVLEGDNLSELDKAKLNLEERIENWLENDISIITNDLLVIGRQVETDFGGVIDLLCLENSGDLVVVELKRDKTPREITAQTLDYASWVNDLSNDKINDLAEKHLGNGMSLEDAFKQKFDDDLPEILNEHHKMLIVASHIDESTERIVKYLSDVYGVGINAATFEYFRSNDQKEYLARVFLIEPSQVEHSTRLRTKSKRKPPLTYEELKEIADKKNVGDIYELLMNELPNYFDQKTTTRSTVAFIGIMDDKRNTIFSLFPNESDALQGLCFQAYVERILAFLGVNKDEILKILPESTDESKPYKASPLMYSGFFKNTNEAEKFLVGLKNIRENKIVQKDVL